MKLEGVGDEPLADVGGKGALDHDDAGGDELLHLLLGELLVGGHGSAFIPSSAVYLRSGGW